MYIRSVVRSPFCPWMERLEGMDKLVTCLKVIVRQSTGKRLFSNYPSSILPEACAPKEPHSLSLSGKFHERKMTLLCASDNTSLTSSFGLLHSSHPGFFSGYCSGRFEKYPMPLHPYPVSEVGIHFGNTPGPFHWKQESAKNSHQLVPDFNFMLNVICLFSPGEIIQELFRSIHEKSIDVGKRTNTD